jgi:hypothetical protein
MFFKIFPSITTIPRLLEWAVVYLQWLMVLDNIIEKNNEPISNLLNIAIKN